MNFHLQADSADEAVRAFTDLFFILDADGVILDCKVDDSILPILQSHKVIHKKIYEILPAHLADHIKGHRTSVLHTGKTTSFEFSLPAADQPRWFDARLGLLPPSRMILLAREVTAHRTTEARIHQQRVQFSGLRSVDVAIASGLDLKLLLSMLLDQVTALLQVDAASVLLLNHETNTLGYFAGKGFITNVVQLARLKVGEGFAGRAALERRMIKASNLGGTASDVRGTALASREHFVAYYGVPLVAKGKVLGVLELFHRSSLKPDADWIEFMNILSTQAAIAIDNSIMFRELQRAQVELGLACDATIDGWAGSLEIRGKETIEHTHHVTDMTIRLAIRMGVEKKDVVHIRRGAILHDIGMFAVPDEILFKAGPLTIDEWEVMRRHPGTAVDLLSPITYLIPALEIPRHHHEKWDGSGYPDQLFRDQIPLAARVFALADVYDSLTSARPYREAWKKQDAARYIESQAGSHFDPYLVSEFLKLAMGN